VSVVLVIAPHPDDETLGCGGTLLRHKAAGDQVHWLIVTAMSASGNSAVRDAEISDVTRACGFDGVHRLNLETARLDTLPLDKLITAIKTVIDEIAAEILYLPHAGDAHSDHRIVFEASWAAVKIFRTPDVRRVLSYETLSETNFAAPVASQPFAPNWFEDISAFLERKIEILQIYSGELAAPPFPRSLEAVRALATLRGSESGAIAAEAFMLLRNIRL
jgi:LmbE family N-acetylglucosaminyl deacetylase